MSDNNKDPELIFETKFTDGQFMVTIHSRHMPKILTALKLLEMQVENMIIASQTEKNMSTNIIVNNKVNSSIISQLRKGY